MSLTEDQRTVLKALGVEKRVSVRSGNGVGKSCAAAIVALSFLYSHDPSIVITTAPTERQVKEVLWREIRHRKAGALQDLRGKPLTMKLDLGPIHYAIGFSTNEMQQIQGFHNPNILIIVDEANRFPDELFQALDGILSGGENAVLFQIGNPIIPIGRFHDSFRDGTTWTHGISCLDHPNVVSGENIIPGAVTKEWVEMQRGLWGEDSAFWQSRVLGQFPRIATDIVINLIWAENAELVPMKKDKKPRFYLGGDIGEYGTDEYVWYVGTETYKEEIVVAHNPEPIESVGITKQLMEKYNIAPCDATIDGIGAGAVVCSKLHEDGVKVNRFVASEKALDYKQFEDKVTEAWWNIRTLLNTKSEYYNNYSFGGRVDRLKSDLCTRKYRTSSHGRLQLEPKKEYRKRMKRSPDYADAMMLCYSFMSKRKVYAYITLPNVTGGN